MSDQDTLEFIQDYQEQTVLWDVNSHLYCNKIARSDALDVLAKKYKMDVNTVKKKIKSLRSYFAKEHKKVKKRKTGSGAEDIYISHWFAYKSLLFIADTLTPNQTKELGENTEDETAREVSTVSHIFIILKSRNLLGTYFS